MKHLADSPTLITGGTGSLGSALVEHLYPSPLTVLSRDPHKQIQQATKYPAVRYILADITDPDAVRVAVQGQQTIIHACALKHVNRGETDPAEYMRVNVLGTLNLARAAVRTDSKINLLISTDKAVEPLNAYGMTKALAEKVWMAHNWQQGFFSVLRYGNVLNSLGSVWHVWQDRLARGQPLEVRTPSPTRFALTIADALTLIEHTIEATKERGPAIYVPYGLHAVNISELARTLFPPSIRKAPLLAGEKQHEKLVARGEHVMPITGYDDLACIVPYGSADTLRGTERDCFCSATTEEMDAQEVVERLCA